MATQDESELPRHIAIIMDGNGRWAELHGKPRHSGHRTGVKATRAVVEACANLDIEYLTLFAFSSENWKRPADEVSGLMRLFVEALQREINALHKNGIRLRFIGDLKALPPIVQERFADAEARTAENTRMQLQLAVSYGGRWDIINAVKGVAADVRDGKLAPDAIDEDALASHLSLAGLPAPDLLIRTGGEQRISNFLLWDLAYSELFFTDTLWPDFSDDDLGKALAFFGRRERRFGQTGGQVRGADSD